LINRNSLINSKVNAASTPQLHNVSNKVIKLLQYSAKSASHSHHRFIDFLLKMNESWWCVVFLHHFHKLLENALSI